MRPDAYLEALTDALDSTFCAHGIAVVDECATERGGMMMTGKDLAEWLADKICNGGDYCKEAAAVLIRQANEAESLEAELASLRAGNKMMKSTLQVVRGYPDFDNNEGFVGQNPFGKMIDEALAGESPRMLHVIDSLAVGIAPAVEPVESISENIASARKSVSDRPQWMKETAHIAVAAPSPKEPTK